MSRIIAALRLIVSPKWINDAMAAIGVVLIVLGAGMVYSPLAPLMLGAIMITLAVIGARHKRRGRDDT